VFGCRSLYDRNNYVKAAARGQISNQDWGFLYGYTDAEAKKPDGIEHIIVLTSTKPVNACPGETEKPKDGREVILGIDGKKGEMQISGRTGQYESPEDLFKYSKTLRKATAAFFDPAKEASLQYQFAKSGKIKVSRISDQFIEGYVVAKLSPEYYANGKFKAKLCKWGQLN
jgi:hypothetical protein